MKAFVAACAAAVLACAAPVMAQTSDAPPAEAPAAAPTMTQAAGKSVSYFFGVFQGDTMVQSGAGAGSDANTRQSRVEIKANGSNFIVTWSTLYLDNGNTGTLKIKDSTQIEFAPTDNPSLFKATKVNEMWSGKPYYWARIDGETLHVTAFVLKADGTYDVADYARTLEGDTMRLEFNRFKDGMMQRQVTGTLKRQAS